MAKTYEYDWRTDCDYELSAHLNGGLWVVDIRDLSQSGICVGTLQIPVIACPDGASLEDYITRRCYFGAPIY